MLRVGGANVEHALHALRPDLLIAAVGEVLAVPVREVAPPRSTAAYRSSPIRAWRGVRRIDRKTRLIAAV